METERDVEVRPLNVDEERLARALGSVVKNVLRVTEEDLQREQRMSAVEYDVLRTLSESPGRAMRPGDLAVRCNQSLSGMSRTVGRLEKNGWVGRARLEEDGRGYNAVLTDAGLERLEEAWRTHVTSVRRHIFDRLEPGEVVAIADALERLDVQGLE